MMSKGIHRVRRRRQFHRSWSYRHLWASNTGSRNQIRSSSKARNSPGCRVVFPAPSTVFLNHPHKSYWSSKGGGKIFSGDNRCFSIFRKCSGLGEHMELRITCAYCSGPKIAYLETVSVYGIVRVKCQWYSQCSWLISTGAWDGWAWGRVEVVSTGVSEPFWSSALWENALLT